MRVSEAMGLAKQAGVGARARTALAYKYLGNEADALRLRTAILSRASDENRALFRSLTETDPRFSGPTDSRAWGLLIDIAAESSDAARQS